MKNFLVWWYLVSSGVLNRKLIPHRSIEFGLPHFNEKEIKNVLDLQYFRYVVHLSVNTLKITKKVFFLFNEDKSIGYNLEEDYG